MHTVAILMQAGIDCRVISARSVQLPVLSSWLHEHEQTSQTGLAIGLDQLVG